MRRRCAYVLSVVLVLVALQVAAAAPKKPLFLNRDETFQIPLRVSKHAAVLGRVMTENGLATYTVKDVADYAKSLQKTEGSKWVYAFTGDIPKDKSGKYSPGLTGEDLFIRFRKGKSEIISIQWTPIEGATMKSLEIDLKAVIAKEASGRAKPGMGKIARTKMGGFPALSTKLMVDGATLNMWFIRAEALDRVYIVTLTRGGAVDPPEFQEVKEGIVFQKPLTEIGSRRI